MSNVELNFKNSLKNILCDKNLLDVIDVKKEINDDKILTDQTKDIILKCCDDNTKHPIYFITFTELLVYVWSRISKSSNKTEILYTFNYTFIDNFYSDNCIVNKLIKLLNTLVGFYDDIKL